MSVNDEQISGLAQPGALLVRHRWATCTECGNHFPMIAGDPAATDAKMRRCQSDAEKIELLARMSTLSERERAVMLRIARGQMPLVMASEMGIDVKTVSTYRARLMEKLNLASNAETAVAVYKAGLLQ